MPLHFPVIVPENNLRLPDAFTVKYGPAPLLSRFVLAADRAARRKGILLRIRHDFEALVDLNRYYVERDLWYPLLDAFDPRCADLAPENSFWISGENEHGEVVSTNACRVLDWTGTNLAEQACALWYGRTAGQRCVVTADMAASITGIVAWGGASWVRPDCRGRHLSYLTPRILKAYACARWPVDWSICYIGIDNVNRGLAATYGHHNLSYSIAYPDSPHGEQVLAYSTPAEFYGDIANFMERGSALEPSDFELAGELAGREHIVTNTSPEGVFHGSISRS